MQATLKQGLRRPPALAILFIAALAMSLLVGPAPNAAPADLRTSPAVLVMVQDPGCPYCARWEAEVGHSYRASKEGKFAPLVTYMRGHPEISKLEKIVYSPTFVMLAYGQEVGRIVGYQGSDLFWMQLEPLVAKAGFVRDH
ncbi:MAG TPA: hypothetical protein VFR73_08090 [Hyphomicrobiaceae bacterium]|nr:hypothetical protein [Hyphomicrobiaceae bacterium]